MDSSQAGKQIAHFRGIQHVQVFYGVWNASFAEFGGHLIPVAMDPIKNSEVFPAAAHLTTLFHDDTDDIGGFGLVAPGGQRDNLHGCTGEAGALLSRASLPRRLERPAPRFKSADA